jgi:hypothetical protein
MRAKLLFNCQKHGHRVDADWPAEAVVVKTRAGKHYSYAMGRCIECGAFYALKGEVPAPTGLVDAGGKVVA